MPVRHGQSAAGISSPALPDDLLTGFKALLTVAGGALCRIRLLPTFTSAMADRCIRYLIAFAHVSWDIPAVKWFPDS